jgi:hypothetical protein
MFLRSFAPAKLKVVDKRTREKNSWLILTLEHSRRVGLLSPIIVRHDESSFQTFSLFSMW